MPDNNFSFIMDADVSAPPKKVTKPQDDFSFIMDADVSAPKVPTAPEQIKEPLPTPVNKEPLPVIDEEPPIPEVKTPENYDTSNVPQGYSVNDSDSQFSVISDKDGNNLFTFDKTNGRSLKSSLNKSIKRQRDDLKHLNLFMKGLDRFKIKKLDDGTFGTFDGDYLIADDSLTNYVDNPENKTEEQIKSEFKQYVDKRNKKLKKLEGLQQNLPEDPADRKAAGFIRNIFGMEPDQRKNSDLSGNFVSDLVYGENRLTPEEKAKMEKNGAPVLKSFNPGEKGFKNFGERIFREKILNEVPDGYSVDEMLLDPEARDKAYNRRIKKHSEQMLKEWKAEKLVKARQYADILKNDGDKLAPEVKAELQKKVNEFSLQELNAEDLDNPAKIFAHRFIRAFDALDLFPKSGWFDQNDVHAIAQKMEDKTIKIPVVGKLGATDVADFMGSMMPWIIAGGMTYAPAGSNAVKPVLDILPGHKLVSKTITPLAEKLGVRKTFLGRILKDMGTEAVKSGTALAIDAPVIDIVKNALHGESTSLDQIYESSKGGFKMGLIMGAIRGSVDSAEYEVSKLRLGKKFKKTGPKSFDALAEKVKISTQRNAIKERLSQIEDKAKTLQKKLNDPNYKTTADDAALMREYNQLKTELNRGSDVEFTKSEQADLGDIQKIVSYNYDRGAKVEMNHNSDLPVPNGAQPGTRGPEPVQPQPIVPISKQALQDPTGQVADQVLDSILETGSTDVLRTPQTPVIDQNLSDYNPPTVQQLDNASDIAGPGQPVPSPNTDISNASEFDSLRNQAADYWGMSEQDLNDFEMSWNTTAEYLQWLKLPHNEQADAIRQFSEIRDARELEQAQQQDLSKPVIDQNLSDYNPPTVQQLDNASDMQQETQTPKTGLGGRPSTGTIEEGFKQAESDFRIDPTQKDIFINKTPEFLDAYNKRWAELSGNDIPAPAPVTTQELDTAVDQQVAPTTDYRLPITKKQPSQVDLDAINAELDALAGEPQPEETRSQEQIDADHRQWSREKNSPEVMQFEDRKEIIPREKIKKGSTFQSMGISYVVEQVLPDGSVKALTSDGSSITFLPEVAISAEPGSLKQLSEKEALQFKKDTLQSALNSAKKISQMNAIVKAAGLNLKRGKSESRPDFIKRVISELDQPELPAVNAESKETPKYRDSDVPASEKAGTWDVTPSTPTDMPKGSDQLRVTTPASKNNISENNQKVKPQTPQSSADPNSSNPYMRMQDLEKVKADAENGVRLAKEALAIRSGKAPAAVMKSEQAQPQTKPQKPTPASAFSTEPVKPDPRIERIKKIDEALKLDEDGNPYFEEENSAKDLKLQPKTTNLPPHLEKEYFDWINSEGTLMDMSVELRNAINPQRANAEKLLVETNKVLEKYKEKYKEKDEVHKALTESKQVLEDKIAEIDNKSLPEKDKQYTPEERKAALDTLKDVYKVAKIKKVHKGVDSRGEDIYGYPYEPDLFVKSDITGKMLRYYVTLPDGRIAHPTEVGIQEKSVKKKIQEFDYQEKQKEYRLDELRNVAQKASSIEESNKVAGDRMLTSSPNYLQSSVLEKDGKFIRVISQDDIDILKNDGFKLVVEKGKRIQSIPEKAAEKLEDTTDLPLFDAPKSELVSWLEKKIEAVKAGENVKLGSDWVGGIARNKNLNDIMTARDMADKIYAETHDPNIYQILKELNGQRNWLQSNPSKQTLAPAKVAKKVTQTLETKKKIKDFGEKIGGARKDTAPATGRTAAKKGKAPAYLKKYIVGQAVNRLNGKIDENAKWNVRYGKSAYGRVLATFDSREEAIAAIPLLEVARVTRVDENKEGKFVLSKVMSNRQTFDIEKFDSKDDAMRYVAKNADKLINMRKKHIERPHLENIQRIGESRRKGNIAPAQFSEAFGFRGVEFGNWLPQDERQTALNFAYDALMDFAEIMNIPPKALSLNGNLAAAFGARGHGLSGAAAHYEPGKQVFNLTRINGAGSLAHEWIHGLDHFLGKDPKALASESYRAKLERKDLQEIFDRLNDLLKIKEVTKPIGIETETKTLERYQKNLDYYITNIRRSLETDYSDASYVKRNKKPATKAQMKQFEKLAAQLREGEQGERFMRETKKRYGGGWEDNTSDVADKIDKLYKKVRGRQLQEPGRLASIADQIKRTKERIAEAEKGASEKVKVATNYYKEAKKLDQGRSKPYYTNSAELLARAAESYIHDKIAENGGRSDYLVYGVENKYYSLFDEFPYPEGEERTMFNKAFNEFFSALKTRKTDQGIEIYEPHAVYQLEKRSINTMQLQEGLQSSILQTSLAYLKKQEGYKAAKEQGDAKAGKLVVNKTLKKLKLRRIRKQLDPNKKTYFVPVINSEMNDRLNTLPLQYAQALSETIGGDVVDNIVKVQGEKLTGADRKTRATINIKYDGAIPDPNAQYVIVDDNFTSGTTVLALMEHLKKQGADVKVITTLAASRSGAQIAATEKSLEKFRKKYKVTNEDIKRITGHDYTKFTEAELNALNGPTLGRDGDLRRIYAKKDGEGLSGGRQETSGSGTPQTSGKRSPQINEPAAEYKINGRPQPSLINTDHLGFFSNLQKAVSEMDFKQIPADQLIARLNKTAGIKREELDDTGLIDYLKGIKGKISKGEVMGFLKANGVQIQEVVIDNSPDTALKDWTDDQIKDHLINELKVDESAIPLFATRAQLLRIARESRDDLPPYDERNTKYGAYTLPGGENDREILLKLPHKQTADEKRIKEIDNRIAEITEPTPEINFAEGEFDPFAMFADPKIKKGFENEYETLKNERNILLERKYPKDTSILKGQYRSYHWDDLNVLAHFRLNDRIVDGKKTLFVEEIQSDWHQDGRKSGYLIPAQKAKMNELGKKEGALSDRLIETRKKYQNTTDLKEKERLKTLLDQLREESDKLTTEILALNNRGGATGVPNAPFKKSWPMLSFKRILRMAAEQGYDAVSWTPGEVQSDRYDLSKQVDEINIDKNEFDNTYNVKVYQKGELQPVIAKQYQTLKQVEELVGKDLAKKASESDKQNNTYSGLDLKVGGEGMKGFYDRMLPKEVGKYIKKLDKGARVDVSSIEKRKPYGLPPTHDKFYPAGNKQDVWTVQITPGMKEKILGGQAVYEKNAPYSVEKSKGQPYSKLGPIKKFTGKKPKISERKQAYDNTEIIQPELEFNSTSGENGQISGGRLQDRSGKTRKGYRSRVSHQLSRIGSLQLRKTKIKNSADAATLIYELRNPTHEKLSFIPLNADGTLKGGPVIISIGSIDRAVIYPREILNALKVTGAHKFIISHNHPSGEVDPSDQDMIITQLVESALDRIGQKNKFLDHIILNGDKFFSFNDLSKHEYSNPENTTQQVPLNFLGGGFGIRNEASEADISPIDGSVISRKQDITISTPEDAAGAIKKVMDTGDLKDNIILFGVDTKNQIVSVRIMDKNELTGEIKPQTALDIATDPGTSGIVVGAYNQDLAGIARIKDRLESIVTDMTVLDAVSVNPDYKGYESVRQNFPNGLPQNLQQAAEVAEEYLEYNAEGKPYYSFEKIANNKSLKPNDPVPAPDGSQSWGEISAEIAKEAGIAPGRIEMRKGRHFGINGFGLKHILKGHDADFKERGYPEDKYPQYIHNILKNYDEIWLQENGRFSLVKYGKPKGYSVIELRPDRDGVYSVVTAYPEDRAQNVIKGNKVWTRRTSRVVSKSLAQSPHLNSRSADMRQPWVEGHTGQTSIDILNLKGKKFKYSLEDLQNMSSKMLRAIARKNDIPGRSKGKPFSKDEIIQSLIEKGNRVKYELPENNETTQVNDSAPQYETDKTGNQKLKDYNSERRKWKWENNRLWYHVLDNGGIKPDEVSKGELQDIPKQLIAKKGNGMPPDELIAMAPEDVIAQVKQSSTDNGRDFESLGTVYASDMLDALRNIESPETMWRKYQADKKADDKYLEGDIEYLLSEGKSPNKRKLVYSGALRIGDRFKINDEVYEVKVDEDANFVVEGQNRKMIVNQYGLVTPGGDVLESFYVDRGTFQTDEVERLQERLDKMKERQKQQEQQLKEWQASQKEFKEAYKRRKVHIEQIEQVGKLVERFPNSVPLSYKDKIRDIVNSVDPNRRLNKTVSKLASLREWIEREAENKNDPLSKMVKPARLKLAKAIDLAYRKNWTEMTEEELKEMRQAVYLLYQNGKTKQQVIDNKRQRELADVKSQAFEVLEYKKLSAAEKDARRRKTDENYKRLRAKGVSPLEAVMQSSGGHRFLIKRFFNLFTLPENLAMALDHWKEDGFFTKKLTEPLFDAWEKHVGYTDKQIDTLIQGINDLKLGDGILQEVVSFPELENVNEDTDNSTMTRAEMIGVYVKTKDPDQLASMMGGNKIPDKTIMKIIKMLSPEEKQLGDLMLDVWDKQFDVIASMYEKIENDHLQKVENYSPKEVVRDAGISGEIDELLQKVGLVQVGAASGMTISRTDNSRPIRLDIIKQYIDNADKVGRYLAFKDLNRKLDGLLTDSDIKQAIELKLGSNGHKILHRWFTDMVYGVEDDQHPYSRIARQNIAASILGLNPNVMLNQTVSAFNAMAEIGPANFAKGLLYVLKYKRKAVEQMRKESQQMAHRVSYESIREEQKKALFQKKGILRKTRENAVDFSFLGVRFLDGVTTTATYYGAKFASNNDIKYAEKIARTTQPNANPINQPHIYRTSEIARIFLMFTNGVSKGWNQYNKHYHQMRKGVIPKSEYAKKTAFMMMIPAILALIQMGFSPNDSEDKKSNAMNFMKKYLSRFSGMAVPVFGQITVSYAEGRDPLSTPMLAPFAYLFQSFGKNQDKNNINRMKFLTSWFGLPGNSLGRMWDAEMRRRKNELISWSEYFIPSYGRFGHLSTRQKIEETIYNNNMPSAAKIAKMRTTDRKEIIALAEKELDYTDYQKLEKEVEKERAANKERAALKRAEKKSSIINPSSTRRTSSRRTSSRRGSSRRRSTRRR